MDKLNKYFGTDQAECLNEKFTILSKEIKLSSIENIKDTNESIETAFRHLAGMFIKLDGSMERKLLSIDELLNEELKKINESYNIFDEKNKAYQEDIDNIKNSIDELNKRVYHDIETDDSLIRKMKNLSQDESMIVLENHCKDTKYEERVSSLKETSSSKNEIDIREKILTLAYEIENDVKKNEFEDFKKIIKARIYGIEKQLSDCKKQSDNHKMLEMEKDMSKLLDENREIKEKMKSYETQIESLFSLLTKKD